MKHALEQCTDSANETARTTERPLLVDESPISDDVSAPSLFLADLPPHHLAVYPDSARPPATSISSYSTLGNDLASSMLFVQPRCCAGEFAIYGGNTYALVRSAKPSRGAGCSELLVQSVCAFYHVQSSS